MIVPKIILPFQVQWGFSTIKDSNNSLTPLRLIQIHSNKIVSASNIQIEADGHWTQTTNTLIGVQVADCVPILLAGLINNHPWIAAIHAGWKGITNNIFRNGIETFTKLGGDPKKLFWVLGPAILKCHFEVDLEVVIAASKDPAWHNDLARFNHQNNKFHLDMHGLLRAQAIDSGLKLKNSESIELCTYCSKDLLNSYRRNKTRERQWGLIKIV